MRDFLDSRGRPRTQKRCRRQAAVFFANILFPRMLGKDVLVGGALAGAVPGCILPPCSAPLWELAWGRHVFALRAMLLCGFRNLSSWGTEHSLKHETNCRFMLLFLSKTGDGSPPRWEKTKKVTKILQNLKIT